MNSLIVVQSMNQPYAKHRVIDKDIIIKLDENNSINLIVLKLSVYTKILNS